MHLASPSVWLAIAALSSIGQLAAAGPVRRADSTTSGSTTATASSSSSSSSTPSTSSSATITSTAAASLTTSSGPNASTTEGDRNLPRPTDASFIACHSSSGPYRPFCQPTNGSDVYIDDVYYVTWDADFFKVNTTVEVLLDYADAEGGGRNAWTSPELPNAPGFVTVSMQSRWLNGNSVSNNLTFSIINMDKTPSKKPNNYPGPTVRLTHKPAKHYPPSPETPKPSKKSLAIGLPVALGAAFFIIFGICLWNRKHRQIGLGNIMGRRRAGYGVGKSRRQRIGGRAGAIKLTDTMPAAAAPPPPRDTTGFRDEPPPRGHSRETSLGSLVSNGTEERFHGNAFRDEVQRQRGGY